VWLKASRYLRDWVKASGAKGIAPEQAFYAQRKPFENSLSFDCLVHVNRTGWFEAARARQYR
jgi:hypothetical protein